MFRQGDGDRTSDPGYERQDKERDVLIGGNSKDMNIEVKQFSIHPARRFSGSKQSTNYATAITHTSLFHLKHSHKSTDESQQSHGEHGASANRDDVHDTRGRGGSSERRSSDGGTVQGDGLDLSAGCGARWCNVCGGASSQALVGSEGLVALIVSSA